VSVLIGIEQPCVDGFRIDCVRDGSVLVPLDFVPTLLVLLGQVGVPDPFALDLQRHRDGSGRHEESLLDRRVQGVGVGGHAFLEAEKRIRIAVDLVFGCCGQPDQQRIEVAEDRPVFLVDGPVCLVDHDQVEMAGTEAPFVAVDPVDQVQEGRIGADVDPPVGGPVLEEVDGRGVRQLSLERVRGLPDQCLPVREEQHPPYPSAAL
jgi:hypothetical protein